MKNFRTYTLAVTFYQAVRPLTLPAHLQNQLLRAASSAALNLAEGSAKLSRAEQRRFYQIAMGSVRECQAIFDLESRIGHEPREKLDCLAASLHCLLRASR
jgi:four helix bundle protein